MKKLYIAKNFRSATLIIIDKANEIIVEYAEQGYELTLRQLYYQFVARDIIPNTDREYHKLGCVINNARLAGLIDWDSIVDRTRKLRKNSHWESPADIIDTCAKQFRLDTRYNQDYYIEVWIEKDALIGVIENTCNDLDVPCFSCRGFVSQSSMYEAALRIKSRRQSKAIILHFGDHDPSGLDMTRDIKDRLELFESGAKIKRVALTFDQIDEYNPPPNPAKVTDSRYDKYVEKYGESSWELDALEPSVITELVKTEIGLHTRSIRQQKVLEQQLADRRSLSRLSKNWDNVQVALEDME